MIYNTLYMGGVLVHSAKGSEKPNHKYIYRRWENGKWRYYYKPVYKSQFVSRYDMPGYDEDMKKIRNDRNSDGLLTIKKSKSLTRWLQNESNIDNKTFNKLTNDESKLRETEYKNKKNDLKREYDEKARKQEFLNKTYNDTVGRKINDKNYWETKRLNSEYLNPQRDNRPSGKLYDNDEKKRKKKIKTGGGRGSNK